MFTFQISLADFNKNIGSITLKWLQRPPKFHKWRFWPNNQEDYSPRPRVAYADLYLNKNSDRHSIHFDPLLCFGSGVTFDAFRKNVKDVDIQAGASFASYAFGQLLLLVLEDSVSFLEHIANDIDVAVSIKRSLYYLRKVRLM